MRKNFLFFVIITLNSVLSHAEKVIPAFIPASTQIAAKIDFNASRKLPAMNAAVDVIFSEIPFFYKQRLILNKSFGMKFPDDISSFYLFSDGLATRKNGSVDFRNASGYIDAVFNSDKLIKAVRSSKGFKSEKIPPYEIMMGDFAPGVPIVIPNKDTIIISSSLTASRNALAVRAKKTAALPQSSPVVKDLFSSAPVILVMSGSKSPNISLISEGLLAIDAEKITFALTEKTPGTLLVSVKALFKTPQDANTVFVTLNGLKVLHSIRGDGLNLPAEVSDAFLRSEIFTDGSSVMLSLKLSQSAVESFR